MKLFILFIAVLIFNSPFCFSQHNYKKPSGKILVVSGGGARGAWGVGVAESLFKQGGAYRAVFGTSTGSLMAPMILLQQFDSLESYYTSVTQKSIFSKNPFKVKEVNGVVTTQLKVFNAIWSLIWNKPTLGETANLKTLIKKCFTSSDFEVLRNRYLTDSLSLNVATTNMNTGRMEIKSSDVITDYETMINWIWASANEPIFMSYVYMNGTAYVDGGVREVVPLRAAVHYAMDHNIDTVEVIVNDSWESQDTAWTVNLNKGYFKGGLMRVLEVYNANTQWYNMRAGELLTEMNDTIINTETHQHKKDLTLIIYSMPYSLASTYRDELGFEKTKMVELLNSGKSFILNKQFDAITRQVFQANKIE